MKYHFIASKSDEAKKAKNKFVKRYANVKPEKADFIIPIGGDGFLLKSLHDFCNLNKPFFGINCGSIGFLMNSISYNNLESIIQMSKKTNFVPLEMKAINKNGKEHKSIAYNEVSLMRQTHLASKINIKINKVLRMNELICDGVLVSTSAGSTAYNLSAHGSILPLDSKILALTPISAFRPRRWRGALLSESCTIEFNIHNYNERSVSVTADNIEFRNIKSVKIISSKDRTCSVYFDIKKSMEDKILNEQFEY